MRATSAQNARAPNRASVYGMEKVIDIGAADTRMPAAARPHRSAPIRRAMVIAPAVIATPARRLTRMAAVTKSSPVSWWTALTSSGNPGKNASVRWCTGTSVVTGASKYPYSAIAR